MIKRHTSPNGAAYYSPALPALGVDAKMISVP